jgi:hypothetical protein
MASMKDERLIVTAWLVVVVVAGCGRTGPDHDRVQGDVSARQLDNATFNAGSDPTDKRIVAFVAWVKRKGVTLEFEKHAEGDGGVWTIAQPHISEEYDVYFLIHGLPTWASEKQMREALDVNLAYMLNAPARLAMSHAVFTGKHPEAKLPQFDDELPKVNGLPVTKAVEGWFRGYVAR